MKYLIRVHSVKRTKHTVHKILAIEGDSLSAARDSAASYFKILNEPAHLMLKKNYTIALVNRDSQSKYSIVIRNKQVRKIQIINY